MIRMIRTALSVVALSTFLFIASALALPQHAAAQMDCVGCIYAGNGDTSTGIGQPGGGWDCGSQPEGASDCTVGADYNAKTREWVSWCEEGGYGCQSLMLLDFTEDGMASWGTATGQEQETATSTCDGVLLHSLVSDDIPSGYDVAPTLVL